MSPSKLSDDLAFVRQMAEEGATAPTLAGRFNVWWGAVFAVAAGAHWAAITGTLAIPGPGIGLIWLGASLVGVIGSTLLARTIRDKPGRGSVGNRAESGVWAVAGLSIFAYFIGIAFAINVRGAPLLLVDTILPLSFIVYAVAYGMSAILNRSRLSWAVVVLCVLTAMALVAFVGSPTLYLIAIAGLVLTQILPGLLSLRAEPKSIV